MVRSVLYLHGYFGQIFFLSGILTRVDFMVLNIPLIWYKLSSLAIYVTNLLNYFITTRIVKLRSIRLPLGSWIKRIIIHLGNIRLSQAELRKA